jgi:hypothetical protein
MLKKVMFAAASLFFAACIATEADFEGSADLPPNFSRVRGVPIPDKSNMDMEKTFMMGTGKNWLGRLNFYAPYNPAGVFDFYVKEMPKYSWTQLSSIRGANSVLTFQNGSRIANVVIENNPVRGAGVSITISDKGMEVQNITGESTQVQAPVSAPKNENSIESKSTLDTGVEKTELTPLVAPKSDKGSLNIPEDASNRNYTSNSKGVKVVSP